MKRLFVLAALVVLFAGTAAAAEQTHYRFNETSGTDVQDYSGNGFTGTRTGATQGAAGITKGTGDWGDGLAYLFDGTDDYVTTPDSSAFNYGTEDSFTLMAWFNTTTSATQRIFSLNESVTNSQDIFIRVKSTGELEGALKDGTSLQLISSTATVADGSLHHGALTYDAGADNLSLYLDGSLAASTTTTFSGVGESIAWRLGGYRSTGTEMFDGNIDEPHIFNKYLSAAQIDSFYTNNTANTPPTVENVTTTPGDPVAGDDVNVSADISDPDGDTISWAGASVWRDGTKIIDNRTYNSTSGGTYNWTDLVPDAASEAYYNISITASDGTATGSQNTSFTADDVTPPSIAYNPSSTNSGTFSQSYIFVNVSATDTNLDTVREEFNGTNSSFTTNMGSNYWENHSALPDDTYTVQAFANDTAGNNAATSERSITLDTTGPTITIHNPTNTTFTSSSVALDVTADETINTWMYELDNNGTNVTFTPNTTLTGLSEGGHTVQVYATDTAGNTGSNSVSFTVDATGPNWRNLQDNVTGGYASKGDTVNISAEWQDNVTGVYQAILSINESGSYQNETGYRINDGFEDGDFTSNPSWNKDGNEDNAVTQTNVKKKGSYAVEIPGGGGGTTNTRIEGLNRSVTVSDGDIYSTWIRASANDADSEMGVSLQGQSGYATIMFGDVSRITSDSNNVYYETDSVSNTRPSNSQQFNSGVWYKMAIEIVDSNNGLVNFRLYNSSNSRLFSDTVNATVDFDTIEFYHRVTGSTISAYFDEVSYDQSTYLNLGNVTGSWVSTSFNWENKTFSGDLGYRIYGRDKIGNWNVTDIGSFFVNAAPTQKNASVTWTDIGGSVTKEVLFGYSDENTLDIKNVSTPPSGSLSSTNTTATVSNWNSPFDWSAFVTDFQSVKSGRRDINITTTDTGYREDDFSHNLSTQQWNRTVSVENRGDLLKSVTVGLADNGTVESSGSLSGQLKTGNNNSTTEVWSGDNITDTEYSFDPQGTVQLDLSYVGDRNLELLNQRAFSWTDIDTTSITTPRKCSQTNNTAVNLSASATTNYTVEYSCDPGTTHNAGLTTTLDLGPNNVTKRNYTATAEIFSNETRTVNVEWKIAKTELTDWDQRSNATADLDGNSTGVTVTEQPNNVIVTFNTSCCSSSPAQGNHSANLIYFIGEEDTTTGGGGGGGGGGVPDQETTVRFTNTNFTVPPGTNLTDTFGVQNYEDEENTVEITAQTGDDCRYVSVQRTLNSDQFGNRGTYTVPSQRATGQFQSFAQVNPQVRIEMPQNITATLTDGTIDCQFSVTAGRGVAEPLSINAVPGIRIIKQIRDAVINGYEGFLEWYRENIGPIFNGTICLRPLEAITGDAECEQSVPRPAPTSLPLFVTLLLAGYTGNRVRQGQRVIPFGE